METSEFVAPYRVYIEDTDAGGVVYYANYFKFMERARTDYLRSLGFPKPALLNDELSLVVVSAAVDYRRSAVLDDLIEVTAKPVKMGRSSVEFEQKAWRSIDGKRELLAEGRIRIACVNRVKQKPQAFPLELQSAIQQDQMERPA